MENQKIKSFTDLVAWQEAHKLVLMVYEITRKYPKEEIFGLTNQTRRASVSTSSNIAEGFSRNTPKDKLQFYCISLGSLTETQDQLLIARDVGYINRVEFNKIADQTIIVNKLVNGLIKKIKSLIHDT